MTHEEFEDLQTKMLDLIKDVSTKKGKEYANSDIDRFANFNRLSDRLGISNVTIAWIYVTKHLNAIENFIKQTQRDQIDKLSLSEPIVMRFVDIIVYMILIYCMIYEKDWTVLDKEQFKNIKVA